MPKKTSKRTPETSKSIERQIKILGSKKKKLRNKLWKISNKKERDAMSAQVIRLEKRRRKLSEKKDKLSAKEAEVRREKRRKK